MYINKNVLKESIENEITTIQWTNKIRLILAINATNHLLLNADSRFILEWSINKVKTLKFFKKLH